jgi:hypothetical protein
MGRKKRSEGGIVAYHVKKYLWPRGNPKDSLEHLRNQAKYLHDLQKRLQNPVHKKTGKPLKESTVKDFQSDANGTRINIELQKKIIRYLLEKGYLDPNSNRHQWRRKVLQRRKLKVLLMGIQELKRIENHVKLVLNGQCELDRFLVWKSAEPAERRVHQYTEVWFGPDMSPEKYPWPEGRFDLWEEWAAGKHFEGDFSSLLQ